MFPRTTPRSDVSLVRQLASAVTQPLSPSDAPSLHEQAEQLARSLSPDALAVLVEASAPLLFDQPDPYAPQAYAQVLARWLRDEVGALTPVSAGYVQAYRPTALGLCVVWRLMVEGVQLRRSATHSPAQARSSLRWGEQRVESG